jgi:hypothetical protein
MAMWAADSYSRDSLNYWFGGIIRLKGRLAGILRAGSGCQGQVPDSVSFYGGDYIFMHR